MTRTFLDDICVASGATRCELVEVIQELWSGYGAICRYRLYGAPVPTVVIKHIKYSEGHSHPRGWDTRISHERKLRSYAVERYWYKHWSLGCDDSCRTPRCLAVTAKEDEMLIVLEDLDHAGFSVRKEKASQSEIRTCLSWLASFHATFMGEAPEGLWEQGTYWQLDTRPDELSALTDIPLKNAAQEVDARLRQCQYQGLVHGDAKLANFCFTHDVQKVAAVDFQYVGGGCGMKDVAYFLGSCLDESECQQSVNHFLDYYFAELKKSLGRRHPKIDVSAVESEWRTLFPFAWTDFHRFLKGWCPGHWKLNDYSERVALAVLASL